MVACAVSVLMCKCPNGELIPTARAPNEPVEAIEPLKTPVDVIRNLSVPLIPPVKNLIGSEPPE